MKRLPSKQTILRKLKKDLQKDVDFKAYLSQKIRFEGRVWTVGQFLYKACFDEWQPFAYYVRDHFSSLTGAEKELAEKLYLIVEKKLSNPQNAYRFIKEGGSLGLFDAEKEAFYQNLFANEGRSERGNPCYWHPVSQCQTAFIEYKLAQMGLNDSEIESLMTHCAKEREKAEKKAVRRMPKQFVHNTVLPPEEMRGGKIDLFVRSDDHFLDLQKLIFMGEPDTFHAGLPIHSSADFAMWPRFKSDTFVFQMSVDAAKRQICRSYNYQVDMTQKEAFRPCIPLWGGKPTEWVSIKPLRYISVQAESLRDLMERGKKIYLVPRKEDWKKYMEKTCSMSTKEARTYLVNLSRQYPGKVIRLDKEFLAEYEKEFPTYEVEQKKKRKERIEKISG